MMKLTFVAPLFMAVSLAAQVPPTPPIPPTPPMAPMAPLLPARPMSPIAPMMPSEPFFDRAWTDEVSANARAWASTARDYASYADDFHFNTLSSLNYSLDALRPLSYSLDALPSLARIENLNYSWGGSGAPVAWAHDDPADSLYRMARDQFSRGDYRRAADMFKSLPAKFPNSAYVSDAEYYQAFSLYRIGGTADLQQALTVLEARKPVANEGRSAGKGTSGSINTVTTVYTSNGFGYARSGVDAAGLAARIANVLSSRGMSNDPAVKRALAAGGGSCDQDDQSVRAEALSALMQNDAETGRQMAVKILSNKDECSIPLRRNAVMLVGNKHDDAATATLIPVAKSDPAQEIRRAAMDYLVRVQTDAAINAVVDIARTDTSKLIQRSAVRALAQSTNARARAEVRSIVENNAADESMRINVVDGIDTDHLTAEDAAWLRALYGKTTSNRVKERIISVIGRVGGDANNQWIQALLRNESEPLESRTVALQHAGRAMDVAALIKTYDASAERPMRETIMQLLSERKEPEALDKILDIAKNGTDTRMRTQAINILSRSKDPRANRLLLSLVDH